MSSVDSLRELLVGEVKILLDAEMQQMATLPGLAVAASNPALREILAEHAEQTRGHVRRLERVLHLLDAAADRRTCRAVEGLLDECTEMGGLRAPVSLRDAALIGAVQRLEHFEIAAYGTVRAFAEQLAEEAISDLFQATIEEEGGADRRLTIVSGVVNADARIAHPAAA